MMSPNNVACIDVRSFAAPCFDRSIDWWRWTHYHWSWS